MLRMPSAATEPKSTSWKVTAQVAEEMIKLKKGDPRVALALHNAKIHRPALYISSKASLTSSVDDTTKMAVPGHNQNSQTKTVRSKKVNKIDCKGEMSSEAKRTRRSGNKSQEFSRKQISSPSGSKFDLNSYQLEKNTATVYNEWEPDLSLEKSENQSSKLVTLSTVNVQPWENDSVQTANDNRQPSGLKGFMDKQVRRAEISRLVSLQQDSNVRRLHEQIKTCADDDCTVQHTNKKIHRPGRKTCSFALREGELDIRRLSEILLVSSKMPWNPCSPCRLPHVKKKYNTNGIKRMDFPVFERGPVMSLMKTDCHLCTECRKKSQNLPRVYGHDNESENLTRLKYRLKLKERQLLEKKDGFDKPSGQSVKQDNSQKSSSLGQKEDLSASQLEELVLPKLYLSHHSTATAVCEQKLRTPRTLSKITDTTLSFEERSNQRYHKVVKIERISAQEQPLKILTKKGSSSTKLCDFSGALPPLTSDLRVLASPLRGFTPQYCSDLAKSPILWRENSELKKAKQEENTKTET